MQTFKWHTLVWQNTQLSPSTVPTQITWTKSNVKKVGGGIALHLQTQCGGKQNSCAGQLTMADHVGKLWLQQQTAGGVVLVNDLYVGKQNWHRNMMR